MFVCVFECVFVCSCVRTCVRACMHECMGKTDRVCLRDTDSGEKRERDRKYLVLREVIVLVCVAILEFSLSLSFKASRALLSSLFSLMDRYINK